MNPSANSIPERQFNKYKTAGGEAKDGLDGDLRIMQTMREYKYDASMLFPYKQPEIWKFLTYSELWHNWLGHYSDKPLASLPSAFGPGALVEIAKPEKHSSNDSARIVDGIDGSQLLIRWLHPSSSDRKFCRVTLSSHSRTETKVSLSLLYFEEFSRPPSAMEHIFTALFDRGKEAREREYAKSHRHEYETLAMRTLKKFESDCFDLSHYGKSFEAEKRNTRWQVWDYRGGRLHIHPDQHGSRDLRPGLVFEKDERIGYIYDPSVHESEEYARENLYISLPAKSVVKAVRKKDGDRIEMGDRLFLYDVVS